MSLMACLTKKIGVVLFENGSSLFSACFGCCQSLHSNYQLKANWKYNKSQLKVNQKLLSILYTILIDVHHLCCVIPDICHYQARRCCREWGCWRRGLRSSSSPRTQYHEGLDKQMRVWKYTWGSGYTDEVLDIQMRFWIYDEGLDIQMSFLI